jgi:hypothetical protein
MGRSAKHASFPAGREIQNALLSLLYKSPHHALWAAETYQPLADTFGLKNQQCWHTHVCTARNALAAKGFLRRRSKNRHWILTAAGKRQAERLSEEAAGHGFARRGPTRLSSAAKEKYRGDFGPAAAQPGENRRGSLFKLKAVGVRANARALVDGFLVLAGSTARRVGTATFPAADRRRRDHLVKDGKLVDGSDPGTYRFAGDVQFQSLSAAAAAVMGCSVSGPRVWRRE